MALDKRTLRRLRRQRRALDRVLAALDADLVDAWVRAWEELASHLQVAAAASVTAPGGAERILRARQAMRTVGTQLEAVTGGLNVLVGRQARSIIERSLADQDVLIRSQLPAGMRASFQRVDARAITAMVERTTGQIESRSLALSGRMAEQMRGELVRSVAVGINPRDAARRIVARCQGVFDGGLARANVIARTEMLDAYRVAAQQSHKAAADVLQGWMWWSEMGLRTCPSCWAQHGSVHDLDEPGPQDHHQGRCSRVPVTKSWADLGLEGIDDPVSAVPDAEERFAQLTEAQQREILGPKRFEAWQQGRYPMSEWSRRVSNGDWRDSYITSPAPGGGAGGGVPPHRPAGGKQDDWNARQDALGSAVARDRVGRLEPGEIEFVERFQSMSETPLDQRLWWLEKGARVDGQTLPTYDFEWRERTGLLIELKSIGNPTGQVIQNRVWKTMNEVWAKHGFTKENFIIDIAEKSLTDEAKAILASYNLNNSGRRLSRLFVMSKGQITEILLEA